MNNQSNAQVNNQAQKTVVFMIGAGGSGKSYSISKTQYANLHIVNSDSFIESHPDFISGALEPKDLHEWASTQADLEWAYRLNGTDSFILDGTGKTRKNTEARIAQARQAGFKVVVVWVYAQLETCLYRNTLRERQVPNEVIVEAWTKVKANYGSYRELADEAKVLINY